MVTSEILQALATSFLVIFLLHKLHVKNIDEFEGNLCVRQKNTIAMIEGEKCEESTVDVINLYKEGRMKK